MELAKERALKSSVSGCRRTFWTPMPYLHTWNTWEHCIITFSTIGVIGLNEMCESMLGCGITDKEGKALEHGGSYTS